MALKEPRPSLSSLLIFVHGFVPLIFPQQKYRTFAWTIADWFWCTFPMCSQSFYYFIFFFYSRKNCKILQFNAGFMEYCVFLCLDANILLRHNAEFYKSCNIKKEQNILPKSSSLIRTQFDNFNIWNLLTLASAESSSVNIS